MEIVSWERQASLAEFIKENELWGSLLNLDLLFAFVCNAFSNSAVDISLINEKDLLLEFLYQMGFNKIILPIVLIRGTFSESAVIIEHSKMIRRIHEEREPLREKLKSLIEEISLLKNKNIIQSRYILIQKTNGTQASTYSIKFTDMMGVKESGLIVKRKGHIKWELDINGLWYNSADGYIASFRIEVTNTKSNEKTFWPNENGCGCRINSSCTGNLSLSFHCGDIAEIEKGTYKVKLQWAYSSNSSSYIMYYNPTYGSIKLLAELY